VNLTVTRRTAAFSSRRRCGLRASANGAESAIAVATLALHLRVGPGLFGGPGGPAFEVACVLPSRCGVVLFHLCFGARSESQVPAARQRF
jgi:hypothetical protein